MDLYPKKRENVLIKDLRQPNLVRQRHKFRGPRESEKFNLEIDQIRFDLLKSLTELESLEEELTELYDTYIRDGANADAIFDDSLVDFEETALEAINTILDLYGDNEIKLVYYFETFNFYMKHIDWYRK